jgi:hypothetical protein
MRNTLDAAGSKLLANYNNLPLLMWGLDVFSNLPPVNQSAMDAVRMVSNNDIMITGAQVRGARAMLGWSARALAMKADVPVFTLEWIEGGGKIAPKDRRAVAAIQATLEAAGIEFLAGDAPGVRLHLKMPKTDR